MYIYLDVIFTYLKVLFYMWACRLLLGKLLTLRARPYSAFLYCLCLARFQQRKGIFIPARNMHMLTYWLWGLLAK